MGRGKRDEGDKVGSEGREGRELERGDREMWRGGKKIMKTGCGEIERGSGMWMLGKKFGRVNRYREDMLEENVIFL